MNKQLVAGEALVRQSSQPTWNQSFQRGLDNSLNQFYKIQAVRKAEKQAINAKVSGYINQLNSDIDLTNLTESQQRAVTNYLVQERNVYAEAAKQISKIDDTSSEQYLDLRDQMNGIQRSFGNLASQLNGFKEDKISYLKDFDDNRVSDGNEIGSLQKASRIYTNEGSMGIGPGGQVTFWDDDKLKYENYSTIQKPFLKDFKSADSILQLNETVYNSGQSLSGARQDMVRNKLKNMINAGGRDTLLSLASDDFLIDGGLNLQDPSLFEPENQELLSNFVLDSYMDALTKTAAQGARDKRPSSRGGSGGFSGALKDEINVSGNVADKALQFSLLSKDAVGGNAVATANQMANIINSIDPTSTKIYVTKGQMYEKFMVGKDEEDSPELRKQFVEQFGDFNMYITNPSKDPREDARGINVNPSDPKSMFEFYINNSDLSAKAKNYYIDLYGKQTSGSQDNTGSLNNL